MPPANKKDDDSELGLHLNRIANCTDDSLPETLRYPEGTLAGSGKAFTPELILIRARRMLYLCHAYQDLNSGGLLPTARRDEKACRLYTEGRRMIVHFRTVLAPTVKLLALITIAKGAYKLVS